MTSNDAWFKSSCHIDTSLWGETSERLDDLEVLKEDTKADVAVIGAGFCGLSTALHLSERGYDVAIVDAHEPGWGASGRNGGQIIPGLKIMPNEIHARYGSERGEQIINTAGNAPSVVYDIIDKYKIECDLRKTGWIQLARGPKGAETINSHLAQWGARNVDVKELDREKISALVGTDGYYKGLLDNRGGNLHPLKYARGLAKACLSNGVKIYKNSPALSVEHTSNSWMVKTIDGNVKAKTVVVCTNGYTGNMLPNLSQSIVPVLTGVIATDPLPKELYEKILPGRQGVADTQRLLSWFGVDSKNRLIFGSRTNSQLESIDKSNFTFGIRRLHEILPQVQDLEIKHLWTGRVALTLDHVPHIHKLADGLYSGLGFNGRGVAMATTFGKILAKHCNEEIEENEFLPITPIKKVPLNKFRRSGITIALTWKRMMDTLQP